MIIETSLFNKILVDDKFRNLSDYLGYLKFWNVEFQDDLGEEIITLYSVCKMLNACLDSNPLNRPSLKKILVLNDDDPYGIASLAYSLFCDFDIVVSHIPHKGMEKAMKDFLKAEHINGIQLCGTPILSEPVAEISNFFKSDSTFQLNYSGKNFDFDDVKTSTFTSLNSGFSDSRVGDPRVFNSLGNRLFTCKNKDYLPF